MARCPYYNKCSFCNYLNTHPLLQKSFQHHYCDDGCFVCARYKLYEQGYSNIIPDSLYPYEHDKALKLINKNYPTSTDR